MYGSTSDLARSSSARSHGTWPSGGEFHAAPALVSNASFRSRIASFSLFPFLLCGAALLTSPRFNPAASRLPVNNEVPLLCMPTTTTQAGARSRASPMWTARNEKLAHRLHAVVTLSQIGQEWE